MLNNEYLRLEDAAREYNCGIGWLVKQIKSGKLHTYTFPGEQRAYLSRKELEDCLKLQQPRN